jgi:hypothetical protein
MYARVASFEGGDMERLRALAEERQTEGTGFPEGVKQVLVLADREANRRLFVTFFESRDALDAAGQQFDAMGDEIPEDVRGRRLSVDAYEVVYEEKF